MNYRVFPSDGIDLSSSIYMVRRNAGGQVLGELGFTTTFDFILLSNFSLKQSWKSEARDKILPTYVVLLWRIK